MRTIFASLAALVALSALSVAAQDPQAAPTLDRLAQSADARLEQSTRELAELRTTIANEKLPLAQELTALEERLGERRREHERLARAVDTATLELASIKSSAKARQDELSYVGNLLDEYARSYDAKVNVSELQACADVLESAQLASENTALDAAQKLERQIAFVEFSLRRLFDVIGGVRFSGVGVNLDGTVTEGQFTLFGPVALFKADAGGTAGLVIPQTGSDLPLIRPLDGAMQAGLVALLETGEGTLPLDPSRGAALKALVQKTNLMHIFVKGGPIMWPLLFASILALGTVLERLLFLAREKMKRDPRALEAFFAAVGRGEIDAAIRIGQGSSFYVVRALGSALAHKGASLANALLYAQAQELKRFSRGISILDTVITLAPLLGLLGTVVGMMGSFSLIGGDLDAPGAITGGIAEALIATAFGLGIAITALLPFNYLNTRLEEVRHEIESAATQLELLVHPPGTVDVADTRVARDHTVHEPARALVHN